MMLSLGSVGPIEKGSPEDLAAKSASEALYKGKGLEMFLAAPLALFEGDWIVKLKNSGQLPLVGGLIWLGVGYVVYSMFSGGDRR